MDGLPTATAEMVPEDSFKTEPRGLLGIPEGLLPGRVHPSCLPPLLLEPWVCGRPHRELTGGNRSDMKGKEYPFPQINSPRWLQREAGPIRLSRKLRSQDAGLWVWALSLKYLPGSCPWGNPVAAWPPASEASRGIHICRHQMEWGSLSRLGGWGQKRSSLGSLMHEGDCGMEERGPFWIWVPQGKGKEPGAPASSAEPLPHKQGCRGGHRQIHPGMEGSSSSARQAEPMPVFPGRHTR